ncbi:MAG: hypothetical protein N4A46_03020 [Schleiferiaceae bacterium]|jgi:hypothetical protein|nr:hypothetical protein [Schleiferiaceae bacterium]
MQTEIEGIKNIMSKEARDELMLKFLEEDRMTELIGYFTSEDKRLKEKAAWILQQTTDQYPEALLPYVSALVDHLPHCETDAEKRFIMRYFNFQPLPENEQDLTQLMNYGFDWLANPKEAIAQRAFAMTTLFKISEIIPELKQELKITIEAQREFGSSGFKNRAKHILKKLDKSLKV